MTDFKGVKFSEKAIGCLELAEALHIPGLSVEWCRRYAALCEKYSERAVNRKMEELDLRGYIDGWLTDKGRAALVYVRGGSNGEGQG